MTRQIVAESKELVFIQSRAETNHELVDEYAALMQEGVQFDAAQGIRDESGQIYIFDGLHRGAAARLAGLSLLVELQPGTKQDAEWLALSANQKHGLRRTKADEEWIASSALIKFPDRSIREIHRHTGINRRKISRIWEELIASGAIAPDNKVTVTRGGVTYQQDTSNIGSTRQEYTPVWKLETAIRQWLDDTFDDLEEQCQVLVAIKDKTPEGQPYLSQLLSADRLSSPKRKRDVIQACHNILEQLRRQTQPPQANSMSLQSPADDWSGRVREGEPNGRLSTQLSLEPQADSKPKPQEFECPRCDKYEEALDNLRAAQLATLAPAAAGAGVTYLWRALEEYGVSREAQTLDQLFAQFFLGFAATPDDTVLLLGSGEEAWWQVLGVEPEADQTAIRNAYRALARRHHPDAGGDPNEFKRLRRAYEAALATWAHGHGRTTA